MIKNVSFGAIMTKGIKIHDLIYIYLARSKDEEKCISNSSLLKTIKTLQNLDK